MGHHQIANAGTAVAAALQLKPLGLNDAPSSAACSRCAGRPACSGSTTGLCRGCWRRAPSCGSTARHNQAGGAGHRADAGRARRAGAQAGRPRGRHDGPQGRARVPRAFPRPRAPRRDRADPGAARRRTTRRRSPPLPPRPASMPSRAAMSRPPSAACRSRRRAAAHPDLRLALSRRPRAGAAGRRAGAAQLSSAHTLDGPPQAPVTIGTKSPRKCARTRCPVGEKPTGGSACIYWAPSLQSCRRRRSPSPTPPADAA